MEALVALVVGQLIIAAFVVSIALFIAKAVWEGHKEKLEEKQQREAEKQGSPHLPLAS
jgi:hypothetical protein